MRVTHPNFSEMRVTLEKVAIFKYKFFGKFISLNMYFTHCSPSILYQIWIKKSGAWGLLMPFHIELFQVI